MTRVAGVGSARPAASVSVNVTLNVPAVGKVTAPGFALVDVAPVPKFHRYVSGTSLSGSVPVPLKVTVPPGAIVTSPVGALIVLSGGRLPVDSTFSSATDVYGRPLTSLRARNR